MPTDAKVMYALLKDRFELSRLNNWVDSENNIYLLYTNKQLCSILNYAEPKIIKLKRIRKIQFDYKRKTRFK